MKLSVVLCFLSLLCLASGQNSLNDCRVVCDHQVSPSPHDPPNASLRGKQGPKGEKGERGLPGETGLPGKDGVDNEEVVSAHQRRINKLESIVYKGLSKEVAQGECLSLNYQKLEKFSK